MDDTYATSFKFLSRSCRRTKSALWTLCQRPRYGAGSSYESSSMRKVYAMLVIRPVAMGDLTCGMHGTELNHNAVKVV